MINKIQTLIFYLIENKINFSIDIKDLMNLNWYSFTYQNGRMTKLLECERVLSRETFNAINSLPKYKQEELLFKLEEQTLKGI